MNGDANHGGTPASDKAKPSADKINILLRRLQEKAARTGAQGASLRPFVESRDENFHVHLGCQGRLDSLTYKRCARRELPADGLEIEVEAAALNFRDVAIALGMYPVAPGAPGPAIGCDGAGRVVAVGDAVTRFKVGDEVLFSSAESTFARYTRAAEGATIAKPPHWSFEQACGLAVILMTVVYALRVPGRLARGERILIHSAAGGVGLAAIQVARLIGAEIWATAGTPEKRSYLESIGIEAPMNSRSLEWVDEIRRRSGGRGVDVILNSIGGEAIDRGLDVLASNGRFLELGVRDLHSGRMLDLESFRRSLAFATINVATIDLQRDRAVIDEIRQWVQEQSVQPLPVRVFPANDIVGAFQYMTKGVHIGRIVVNMKGAEILTLAD